MNSKPLNLLTALNTKTPTEDLLQIINNLWIGFFVLILLLVFVVLGFLYMSQKSRKKNKHILITALKDNNETIVSRVITEMNKNHPVHQPNIVTKIKVTPDRKVPIKIVVQIKKSLQKFEKKQEFLDPDLKLTKLAEQFETNTKYLSKVIYQEKAMPYKSYIKNLKIAFAKSRIDAEYKFRRYKMEVIANECGFKTAESFSKCFLQTYGLYPSKYIKKVEEDAKKRRLIGQ